MLLLYKCSNTHFTQKKGQNDIWQLFLGGETYKELFLSNFYISPQIGIFMMIIGRSQVGWHWNKIDISFDRTSNSNLRK